MCVKHNLYEERKISGFWKIKLLIRIGVRLNLDIYSLVLSSSSIKSNRNPSCVQILFQYIAPEARGHKWVVTDGEFTWKQKCKTFSYVWYVMLWYVQPHQGVDYRLQILGSFDIHNNFHLHHWIFVKFWQIPPHSSEPSPHW